MIPLLVRQWGFSLDTITNIWYNYPMNDDPCMTAHRVASMIHDLSLTDDGFDSLILLKLYSCVEQARGFDYEFMDELHTTLYEYAEIDDKFEDALQEAEVSI
jgi:hypothetical protein